MHEIELSSYRPLGEALEKRLKEAAKRVLREAEVAAAEVSLAVVDDATIHRLNRRHLSHDYPTDVLSFLLADPPPCLEGEVIVSWDRACEVARQYGWPVEDELLLYVIHGMLHLVGYDDHDSQQLQRMREAETRHLASLGRVPPDRLPESAGRDATPSVESAHGRRESRGRG
jgi:probable rRNA maturation factor